MTEYSTSPANPEEGRIQLREYLGVLRLRKWSILLTTLLVVGGALLFSVRQTPVYESESRVLVEPVVQAAAGFDPSVNMATEGELVNSAEVADLVADDLGSGEPPERLLRGLSVDVAPQTEILVIRYEDPDPLTAKRRAQSFALSYLEFRRQHAEEELLAAAQPLEKRKASAIRERTLKEKDLAELPLNDPERTTLNNQIAQLNSSIALLENQLAELDPAGALQVGQVVAPATLPSEPVSPDYVRNTILGLLLGLGLGVGIAFLRERLDDRLRGRMDLETHLGAPVLAVIPRVASWRRRGDTPLVTLAEPRSNTSEAYRTLRTSLLFSASQRGVKTLLVTSPQAGEGKTATSANLAVVLAQAQKRVILVSADLRKPRLHRFFGTSNEVGLTSVLIGEAKPWEAVKDNGLDNLKIVPSGPIPGNPAELLGSDAMGRLLAQFREVADFVIVDTAPALVVADALALAPFVDAALFIGDAEYSTRGAVTQARTQLDQVDAKVIGGVLNNFDPSKARLSPYYYSYYYQYQYGNGEPDGGKTRRRLGRKEAPQPDAEATGFEAAPGPRRRGRSGRGGARGGPAAPPTDPASTGPAVSGEPGSSPPSGMEGLWGQAAAQDGRPAPEEGAAPEGQAEAEPPARRRR
jgi:non-specific protein-tyrosine kinase